MIISRGSPSGKDILIIMCLTIATAAIGISLGTWLHPPKPRPRSIDLEAQECIDACIKAMRDNQVFPDFQAIVKECDARFGDGCELKGTEP